VAAVSRTTGAVASGSAGAEQATNTWLATTSTNKTIIQIKEGRIRPWRFKNFVFIPFSVLTFNIRPQ
jgi:hypothetical protein